MDNRELAREYLKSARELFNEGRGTTLHEHIMAELAMAQVHATLAVWETQQGAMATAHALLNAAPPAPAEPVELDRPRVESDRYIVLLACGHWVHTRIPDAEGWECPVIGGMHGTQPAALTTDGKPAVLGSWDLYADQADTNG